MIYFWFAPMRTCQQYIINWWWIKVCFKDSGGISQVIYYKLRVWLLLFIWNLKQTWIFPEDYLLKHKIIWTDLMIHNCWKVSIIHFAVICRNCAYSNISAHLCNKFWIDLCQYPFFLKITHQFIILKCQNIILYLIILLHLFVHF